MKNIKAKEYAELIKEVFLEKADKKAAKCGYDLMCGIDEGNADERAKAWRDSLNGNDNNEERNGIWVPAIPL